MRAPRVLISGLGFGFTLKAALAVLPAGARVVHAEILEAVIAWNREPALRLSADAMSDARVTVRQQDVGELIRESRATFDAIILDVDNGPDALSTHANAAIVRRARFARDSKRAASERLRRLLVRSARRGVRKSSGAGRLSTGSDPRRNRLPRRQSNEESKIHAHRPRMPSPPEKSPAPHPQPHRTIHASAAQYSIGLPA
jgi:hypothetical protein